MYSYWENCISTYLTSMKYPMNHRSLTSKSLMPATPSAMNEDVVQNVWNYYSQNHHSHDPFKIPRLFPDFSQHFLFFLTHNKILWQFPDFCLVWNFPDFSLTAGHPALTCKGRWRGALMYSMIAWINAWINNRKAGDLRRNRAHYDVIVMWQLYKTCQKCVIMFAGLLLYFGVRYRD